MGRDKKAIYVLQIIFLSVSKTIKHVDHVMGGTCNWYKFIFHLTIRLIYSSVLSIISIDINVWCKIKSYMNRNISCVWEIPSLQILHIEAHSWPISNKHPLLSWGTKLRYLTKVYAWDMLKALGPVRGGIFSCHFTWYQDVLLITTLRATKSHPRFELHVYCV